MAKNYWGGKKWEGVQGKQKLGGQVEAAKKLRGRGRQKITNIQA